MIGKEPPHEEENQLTGVEEAHNAAVPKKLHISPGSKFKMTKSTRAQGLQPVKSPEQGIMNANLIDLEHLEMTQ